MDAELPYIALQMLQLAKDVPFTIRRLPAVRDDRGIISDLIAAVVQKHAHLEDVQLRGEVSNLNRVLTQMSNPMLFLSSFRVDNISSSYERSSLPEISCSLLNKVATPRLRHLELTDVMIPWTSSCLENPTSLTLTIDHHIPRLWVLTELFHSLTRIPRLNSFRLRIGLTTDPDPYANFNAEVGSVTLNPLACMSLKVPTTLLIQMLRSLVMPRLSSARVENVGHCSATPTLETLLSAIHKCFAAPLNVKTLCFYGKYHYLLVRVNDEIEFSSLDSNAGSTFAGCFALTEGMLTEFLGSDVHPLLACLKTVPECQLESIGNQSTWSCIQRWIVTLPHLRTLVVTRWSVDHVLDPWNYLKASTGGSLDAQPPFPSLQTLHFERKRQSPYDSEFWATGTLTKLRRLATILTRMKHHGRSIDALFSCSWFLACEVEDVAKEFGLLDSMRSVRSTR